MPGPWNHSHQRHMFVDHATKRTTRKTSAPTIPRVLLRAGLQNSSTNRCCVHCLFTSGVCCQMSSSLICLEGPALRCPALPPHSALPMTVSCKLAPLLAPLRQAAGAPSFASHASMQAQPCKHSRLGVLIGQDDDGPAVGPLQHLACAALGHSKGRCDSLRRVDEWGRGMFHSKCRASAVLVVGCIEGPACTPSPSTSCALLSHASHASPSLFIPQSH